MTEPALCTCANTVPPWCVQCGCAFAVWPAALAERLERAARELPITHSSAGCCELMNALSAVAAARARGEIPPRREAPGEGGAR